METSDKKPKTKKQNFNFRPDTAFKYLFTNLSNETRIKLLNSIFDIHLKEDTKIIITNTENILANLVDKKLQDTRSDIILNANYKRKIHIEFQSTKDNNMGFRIFLYGLVLAKSEKGKVGSKEEVVLKFPLSHVLYTVLYGKDKYGKDSIILDIPNCTIENKFYKDCKIKIDVKYTNLLAFSFDDFKNKNLEVLSFFYLYKYIKNTNKCKTDEDIKTILNDIDTVSKILKSVPYFDKEKLIIPITDMILDITNIAAQNLKNKEMVQMLQERVKTYAETIRDESEQIGMEKGEKLGLEKGQKIGMEKTKLEVAISLLDVLDDKTISEKINLPLDIIKELRDSQTPKKSVIKHKSHSQER